MKGRAAAAVLPTLEYESEAQAKGNKTGQANTKERVEQRYLKRAKNCNTLRQVKMETREKN